MKQSVLNLQNNIADALGADAIASDISFDELTIEISPAAALASFQILKDSLGFDQLMDLCGVDYLDFGQANWETMTAANQGFSRGVFDFEEEPSDALDMERRFAVVYHLLSVKHNLRVRVKVYPESTSMPIVDSVIDVWNCADWFEREAFDLFGILFKGHPDLRRILTDYGFIGHPLRKDFPLTGHVEMRYDVDKGRVVYEPVTIENRVNVPKVIRKPLPENV
ncbi:MAG TPA: NADH-quinone oxidoreductase subunit C [Thiomicrorhabdus sp.]|nr:NADH-quinone oxidoreductase subunit C [Thiomicrorhabdus sp.]